jgi:hypothetical protein
MKFWQCFIKSGVDVKPLLSTRTIHLMQIKNRILTTSIKVAALLLLCDYLPTMTTGSSFPPLVPQLGIQNDEKPKVKCTLS